MTCDNAHIGRLQNIGIGKETTSGTAVSAAYWIPRISGDLKTVVEQYKDEGVYGVIEGEAEMLVSMETSELELETRATDQLLGLLLIGAFGQVSSDVLSGETVVYKHDFTVKQDNTHPSFTVIKNSPVASNKATYMKVEDFEITAAKGEEVKIKVTMKGQKQTSVSTPAVSYITENTFLAKQLQLKWADTEEGLTGATAISIDEISFKISKNLEMSGIGDTPDCIFNKQLVSSGSIDGIFKGEDRKNLVTNSTKKFLQITITNPTTIGTAAQPTLIITLAKVGFDQIEQDNGTNDIVHDTLTRAGLWNNAAGYSVKASLINTVPSY